MYCESTLTSFKIFSSTTLCILIKHSTKHSWIQGIQICSNEGQLFAKIEGIILLFSFNMCAGIIEALLKLFLLLGIVYQVSYITHIFSFWRLSSLTDQILLVLTWIEDKWAFPTKMFVFVNNYNPWPDQLLTFSASSPEPLEL